MISVEEASQIVLENVIKPSTIQVVINKALGKILQEDILADRDFPPFDRVMMDGIAIHFDEFELGRKQFEIEATQMAGMPPLSLQDKTKCIEVMTGAMLPDGTNVVIRYEDITIDQGVATVNIDDVRHFKNIHSQGRDQKEGSILIKKGKVLEAPEIAILATVGRSDVLVSADFKFAIISTGDELVDIDNTPKPYQIRRSNAYALRAEFARMGYSSSLFHLKDDLNEIRSELKKILEQFDAVLLSGGVSMGKRDYVPQVLEELGVQKLFHKVKQRPGKPFWFGRKGEAVIFALPGNPVSTFMCFHRYVKPWVLKSLGNPVATTTAILTEDIDFAPGLTYFLQVKASFNSSGQLMAQPVAGQGSGDLANLLVANGFLEMPNDREAFKKGEIFNLYFYR